MDSEGNRLIRLLTALAALGVCVVVACAVAFKDEMVSGVLEGVRVGKKFRWRVEHVEGQFVDLSVGEVPEEVGDTN